MEIVIRPVAPDEIDELVELALAAWAPVFRSFERLLGDGIYSQLYPDWRASQQATVEAICRDAADITTWVADLDGTIAGFVAFSLNHEAGEGEVELLAVHPSHQNRGIGTALNRAVLAEMKERGMKRAVAGTGGDPGHAPARRSYEKAGYRAFPQARYYQDLTSAE